VSPEPAPAGRDDPPPVAPAPVAREATADIHPRYQREWERDTPHWPKDAAMDAGELNLPERTHAGSDHSTVLVSVEDAAAGTDVAWVDKGVAEVVFHAARLGVPTVESCEAADPGYGWRGGPTLWFKDYRTFKQFRRVIEPVASPGWFDGQNTSRTERLLRFIGRSYPVEIPPNDLPRLTAHLRSL
jgi:hypothetical protein